MARNLLFITTDQQRFDSLPCYGRGFVQAPNLERIAREGTVFERCYVTSPVCVPSRASMMCGQWPSACGVMGNGSWLPDAVPTWPSALGAAGKRTAAIGKMHFAPWDLPAGFGERITAEDKRHMYLLDDHYQWLKSRGIERPHPVTLPGYYESLGAPAWPHGKETHIDAFVGDRAAEWIEKHGREPFAAWVSFPGPHDPYDPPPEFAKLYENAPIPEPVGSRAELSSKPRAQRNHSSKNLNNGMFRIDCTNATPEQYRRWRQHYFANITLIDEGIGKMLAALERAGTLDETLIVFTSDHGDALGDHGLCYKSFFYESMAHVPLLVRGPGAKAGARCAGLVSTLDLVPLFYEVTGAEKPKTLQGRSIAPLLADPAGPGRELVFCEYSGRAMAFDGRIKYVQYATSETELYDLRNDPDELDNRAGRADYAGDEARLREALVTHWLENMPVQARNTGHPTHPLRVAIEKAYIDERGRIKGEGGEAPWGMSETGF